MTIHLNILPILLMIDSCLEYRDPFYKTLLQLSVKHLTTSQNQNIPLNQVKQIVTGRTLLNFPTKGLKQGHVIGKKLKTIFLKTLENIACSLVKIRIADSLAVYQYRTKLV